MTFDIFHVMKNQFSVKNWRSISIKYLVKSGRTNSTIRILDKIGILYVNILVIEKGSG